MHTVNVLSAGESQLTVERDGSLMEIVESIWENAVDRSRKKLLPRIRDAALSELLERRDFVDFFRYALAQEVARVIAAYDQRVQAVYLFEESANPDAETEEYLPSVDVTVHLLARVTSASAALDAFVTSLDRALTDVLRGLSSPALAQRNSLLDVIPVTERDVEAGRGYAILLSSIYGRPLKVWHR